MKPHQFETVTVRVTDAGGLTRDLTTTISVVNVNVSTD